MKSNSNKWGDKSSWWDDYKINGSRYNSGNGYFSHNGYLSQIDERILNKMRENIKEAIIQTDLTKMERYQKEKEDELDTSLPIFWGSNGNSEKGKRILDVLETFDGNNKYNYDCCLFGYIYGISKEKTIISFYYQEDIDAVNPRLVLNIEDFLKL